MKNHLCHYFSEQQVSGDTALFESKTSWRSYKRLTAFTENKLIKQIISVPTLIYHDSSSGIFSGFLAFSDKTEMLFKHLKIELDIC